MKGFIYGQTQYNLLNSAVRLNDYIKMAKNNSFDFLTITDKTLYGAYKFYLECKNNNIKPIIGIEYSYEINNIKSRVLLYAKNNNGYKNIIKISTLLKTDNNVLIDDVLSYDDIFFVYVLNNSYLEALLEANDDEMVNELLLKLKNDNLFIGVSPTNKPSKINNIKAISDYANKLNINILPIHQCLYLKPEDQIIYESLRKIDNDEANIDDFDDYSFLINPLADERIDSFVNNINLDLYNEKINMPKFPNTKGVSSKQYLDALCFKGLEKRGLYNDLYVSRLNYELSIINKMNYDDYFLIVWDYIRFSKTHDILVGPGRGSAAGSLVAYCLGITDVDPIKYNLLFERFLNPERISMPDIDTDFPDKERDRVIDYVKNLYGDTHVCNITTFGTFQIKSSAKDLAKVFKIDQERIDNIVKMIYQYGYDKLLEEYKNTDLYDFLYVAKGIEDFPKNISTHAAGIIISDKSLDDIIPLQSGINNLYQSQFEQQDLEKIGLLKMDFLGIKNLTMVNDMMSQIDGFDMKTLRNIPLDDKKVYDLLGNADTLGIFQLESAGIRKVLRDLKPEKFSDIVAVVALYRPGPMDNIPEFIRRRHGEKFDYIHPNLAPILKETYGIIVYQEQIMQIAQVFAGFSLGEADLLRRAISKKDSSKLEALSSNFITRSIEKGYSKDLATKIYDLIYKFADYGFNKSHSVAYSLLAYQMAYFKANYFNVFMSCMLNYELSNSQTLASYVNYAKRHNLIILAPNVNVSRDRFIYEINRLFMPLSTVYSIGSVQERQIIDERDKNGLFKSYKDFKERCSFLSQSQIKALVFAGALDIFGKTKKNMIDNSSSENDLILNYLDGVIEENNEYDFSILMENERKYLGFNLNYNIYNNLNELIKKYNTIPLDKIAIGEYVNVIVSLNNIRKIKTKKGEMMCQLTITDGKSDYRAIIFPKKYELLNNKIATDKLLIVRGRLEKDNNYTSFSIIDINNI